ncbi:ribonuclease PH [bacterium]|nr:ribonuclease PH [bacterium]
MRSDNRKYNQLRHIEIVPNFLDHPLGSALISFGRTRVLCSVSMEEKVPKWIRGSGQGWITAEYSMLPSAGIERMQREATRGKIGGRTHEIQRLIGRSFRSVCDLSVLGERTVWVDCDVIQADGGTRTASITGGFTALMMAVNKMMDSGILKKNPLRERVAAISVGIVKNEVMLDLDYEEDSAADVDMNLVMTESGKIIEIQGTAEKNPFSKNKCNEMIDLAFCGIKKLLDYQQETIGKI